VSRLVIDPAARAVTHLVIDPKHRRQSARLVPLDLVDTTAGKIRLRCTIAEFGQLNTGSGPYFGLWREFRDGGSTHQRVASPVVVRRRERVSLTLDLQFIFVELAADLGPLLLIYVGLSNIPPRRRVARRRHLVRVVIVNPGRYPLLLGQAGKPVVIDVLRNAAVLMAVAAELLGRLV